MGHRDHHNDTQPHGREQENSKTEEAKATREDRIRQRAYELSQAKPGGSETRDWLQAETEILRKVEPHM